MTCRPRSWWPALGLLVVLAALLAVGPTPAHAHSFLVDNEPAQGQRLEAAPDTLDFTFSERVDRSSVVITMRTAQGQDVELSDPRLGGGGLQAHVPLGELADGIYVVSWQALSAVDGHGSSGEFAFAVGEDGTIPQARTAASTSGPEVIANWLFFPGLAVGAGGLALRAAAARAVSRRAWLKPAQYGLALAAVGAGVELLAASSGGLPVFIVVQLLLAALVLLLAGVSWPLPLGAVLAAAWLWAGRSHGAEQGLAGHVIDFVHLTAAAIWVGALGLVVSQAWRRRREPQAVLPLVRAYAKLAWPMVVILGAAGVIGAVRLLPDWPALTSTRYGQLALAKGAIFGGVVVLASGARFWWLRRRPSPALRRVMTVEFSAAITALAVAGLLAATAPPQLAPATDDLLGAPPLTGDVARDAGLAGQVHVNVAANGERLNVKTTGRNGPAPEFEVAVVRPDGTGLDLAPRPCGEGCVTQALQLTPGDWQVQVSVPAPEGLQGGDFTALVRWPPDPAAPDRLDDLINRMQAVPEVTFVERVHSGPGTHDEPHTFTMSGAELIQLEPYAGGNVTDVRLLPGDPPRLKLYLPGEDILATLTLDHDGRLSNSVFITPGHEITRTFTYPD